MRKREIAWIVVLLLLAGAYICFFTNRNQKTEIEVVASIRPMPQFRRRGGVTPATNAPAFRMLFSLDTYYKLTGIKVTEISSQPTNGAEHVLWHLVSKSSSPPLKLFTYGQAIQGLDPYLQGVQPESLVPGVKYRIEVSAGSLKGVSLPFAIPVIPNPDSPP